MSHHYPRDRPGTLATMEADFDAIANQLLAEPGVDEGTGFGKQPGLRVGGKIFAMLIDGELVVKLPAERCAELTAGGASTFQVGKRQMREWVSVPPGSHDWSALAREALAFGSPHPPRG
jgi:YjbR